MAVDLLDDIPSADARRIESAGYIFSELNTFTLFVGEIPHPWQPYSFAELPS